MLRATFFAIVLAGWCTGSASGQNTGASNPFGNSPNFYNRGNQPLSPYLNLLRGGNNAVNYFYGVRPGVAAGGYNGMFNNNNAARQSYFPYFDNLSDLVDDPRDVGRIPPTGHQAGFFNTLGYFPATGNRPGTRQQSPLLQGGSGGGGRRIR
jgi:hypothetical protein